MKCKTISVIIFAVALVVFTVGCGNTKSTQLIMATGGTAGTYYPIGDAMAKIISDNVDGVKATAITSEGSVANARSIGDKNADLALVENTIAYYAEQGSQMFAEHPVKDIRGIGALYPEIIQIVTLKEYGITDLSDLKGKVIGIGAPGSGTAVHILEILKAVGLSETNVDIQYLDFSESVAGLKNGTIHAGCIVAGTPTSAVMDIASAREIAIIPVPNGIYTWLSSKYPFYVPVLLPLGTYPGVDENISTIAVQAMLVTRADLAEDMIYSITLAIFEHTDVLVAAHERGREITLKTVLDGMSIPLHPGAQKYYEEKGLVINPH